MYAVPGTFFYDGEQAPDYPFEIYARAKLLAKLTYRHENPVQKGLVRRTTDWKWSSARWYEWGQSVGVPIEWME